MKQESRINDAYLSVAFILLLLIFIIFWGFLTKSEKLIFFIGVGM